MEHEQRIKLYFQKYEKHNNEKRKDYQREFSGEYPIDQTGTRTRFCFPEVWP